MPLQIIGLCAIICSRPFLSFGGAVMKLYENNPMNSPRLATDLRFGDFGAEVEYGGAVADAFDFVTEAQLKSREHWRRFVEQYKMEDADGDGVGFKIKASEKHLKKLFKKLNSQKE